MFVAANFSRVRIVVAGLLFALCASLAPSTANAVLFKNFPEYGTNVNGFQDDFGTTSFNAGWRATLAGAALSDPALSGAAFNLPGDGRLHMGQAAGDPNKLLYNGQTYNGQNQNVLALIRVTDPVTPINGLWRGGVGTAADPASSFRGINSLFKGPGFDGAPAAGTGNHIQILDDAVAWGNANNNLWTTNSWYFLRLTHDAANNAVSHIWPADNVTPESSALTVSHPAFGARSGLAGLVTNSNGAVGTFEVDYVLIQAAGLSSISVVPEPGTLTMLGCGAFGLLVFAKRRRVKSTL